MVSTRVKAGPNSVAAVGMPDPATIERLELFDALAVTASEKIQRFKLREYMAQKLAVELSWIPMDFDRDF